MLCPTVGVGYCQGGSSSLRPGMCCVRQWGSGTVKVDPLAYVQVCVVSDSGVGYCQGGSSSLRPGMCCVRQLGSGTVKVDPLAYVQVCVVSDSVGRVLSR